MKTYEITFITKEDLKEKPVKAILEGLSGKILSISSLGQKSFTYPIKKEKVGYYTAINFEIESDKVMDLTKKLALEEEILRFLVVNTKPAAQMAELPAKEVKETEIIPEPVKDIIEEPEKEIVEVVKEETAEKTEEPTKEVKKAEAKPKKATKVKAEKPKVVSKAVKELIEEPVSESERLDELDKKLEELLKE